MRYHNALVGLAATGAGVLLADDSDTVFAYQLGVGIKYAIDDKWSVGAGYRYFATSDPELTDSAGGEFDSEYSSHIFTVGLGFNF